MSRPSVRMSPRPIDEAAIRSEVIGDAHDAYEAICGSVMTALLNLGIPVAHRRDKHGTLAWHRILPVVVSRCSHQPQEAGMKARLGWPVVMALAGLSVSAYAQAPPPGSYKQSCWDIRMQGTTLTAVCRRASGRGEQLTALNVARCVGDIGNNN